MQFVYLPPPSLFPCKGARNSHPKRGKDMGLLLVRSRQLTRHGTYTDVRHTEFADTDVRHSKFAERKSRSEFKVVALCTW